MSVQLAETIWFSIGAYLAAGSLFGVYFAFLGVDRIDSAAQGSGLAFRLLIFPGAAALWPILLAKTIFARAPGKGRK